MRFFQVLRSQFANKHTPFSSVKEEVLHGHTKQVVTLSFSPDGAWMLSGGLDGHLLVWSLHGTPQIVQDLNHFLNGAVTCTCWTGDDSFVIGTADGTIVVYRSRAMTEEVQGDSYSSSEIRFRSVFNIVGHSGPVEVITCDMNQRVASAGGRTVCLWNIVESALVLQETPGASRGSIPRGIAFLSGGEKLLVGYLESHEVICFQVMPWAPLAIRQVQTRVGCLSVSQDDKLVLISNLCDGVDVYQLPDLELIKTFKRPQPSNFICQAVFACSDRFVVAGNEEGKVIIYDFLNGDTVKQLSRQNQRGPIHAVQARTSDGVITISYGSIEGPAVIWHGVLREPSIAAAKAPYKTMLICCIVLILGCVFIWMNGVAFVNPFPSLVKLYRISSGQAAMLCGIWKDYVQQLLRSWLESTVMDEVADAASTVQICPTQPAQFPGVL